jgi:hypothetical protein
MSQYWSPPKSLMTCVARGHWRSWVGDFEARRRRCGEWVVSQRGAEVGVYSWRQMRDMLAGERSASSGVYLIHISPPYRHARHYLGWSYDVVGRFAEHASGRGGSPLVNAALAAGCELELVRTWVGWGRKDERRLKNTKCVPSYCPRCRAAARATA